MPIMYNFIDIIIAFIIDLMVGDPYWMPHPVRYIGWVIKKTESILRRIVQKGHPEHMGRNERITGGILTIVTVSATFLPVFFLLKIAYFINPILFHILNIYFIYSAFATKCLAIEANKVYSSLAGGDLHESRRRLSMLVGRQTEHLNKKEIVRGVVETTAENTVDGIISPMFYAIIGSFFGLGAPLVWIFKAISTMDSMVGYMNEKYINFGKISARTDDAANYLPARLSGVIIPTAAFLLGLDYIKSFVIMIRDRHNHKSPNCAWPEAAFAGAMGIKIGGSNVYFGQLVEKPTIGDSVKEISEDDILKAIRLMYTTAVISLVLGLGIAATILFIC
uniref:adenosylcobinamide-phosphate synthase CbiB n=1 Tax=Acetivibrio cellulolyticus TaxID=35830 RepID=UPI0002481B6C|nr:adenosylcobinamide-phosphate synthase CbiB [Acetivibrio cellulolyticus]